MVGILSKLVGKGVSKARKARKRPASTPPKEKSAATIAREERNKARMTRGTKALKALQLEAQRKAKDAKRGVDKKKQAAVKKRIAAKPAVKKRKQQDAQIAAIKKERKGKPRQGVVGREGQAITSKNKNPDAVFTSGDNEIVAGLKSSPSIRDNTTNAQKNRAKKIVALEKKVREGTATSAEKTELKKLDKINRDDTSRAAKSAADTRNKPARKARLKAALNRMGGGKVVKKNKGGKIEKEKELNKRLRAIGVGGKTGTMRSGLKAAGKSADKRESKVDRSGQKRAAKQAVKTMAPASSMLFGDYDESKSKKKRKPSGSYGKAALGGVTEKDLFYGLKETGSSNTKKQGSKNKPIRLKKPKEGKSDSSVTVDYTVIDKLKSGGKVKGYKKGGPITYRMTGGQVVDNSYD
jgi:hypothetical protein